MKNLFIDTDIIIDLLAKREKFYLEAQELFTLADKREVKLYISSLTFANTHDVLSRELNTDAVSKILSNFKLLVKILPLDDKILSLALSSDFKDFEDAVQYFTAIENNIGIIISRNKKDFKTSKIPVLTAREYLKR